MRSNFGVVKNPLSVIAIFAGIAEISGTAVLPHIDPSNQELYIWFLMSFPFALVLCFFAILNWNHKVLYAPSDYEDEDNFIALVRKATKGEVESHRKENAEIELDEWESYHTVSTLDNLKDIPNEGHSGKAETSAVLFSTKDERTKDRATISEINSRRMSESQAIIEVALRKLEIDLNVSIEKDLQLSLKDKGNLMLFDGAFQTKEGFTVIEVVRFNMNTFNSQHWKNKENRYEKFYAQLTEVQKQEISLLFVAITDDSKNKIESMLAKHFSNINLFAEVIVYKFDDLALFAMPRNRSSIQRSEASNGTALI